MKHQQAEQELEPLRYSEDLNRLQSTVEKLDKQMSQETADEHFRFLLHVCNVLSTHHFGDSDLQRQLIPSYAAKPLGKLPALPLREEFELLVHLEEDFADPRGQQDWPEKRRQRVSRWLRALQRLDQATQRDFDFK